MVKALVIEYSANACLTKSHKILKEYLESSKIDNTKKVLSKFKKKLENLENNLENLLGLFTFC